MTRLNAERMLSKWRRRHCNRINRYCVNHDVSVWDVPEVRRRCPTFAEVTR